MPLKSDFDKMTLDELTPIVSMRPGNEYTKEELRAARLAFMEKLGCANPEVETEEEPETDVSEDILTEEPAFPEILAEEIAEPVFETPSEAEAVLPPVIEDIPEVPAVEEPTIVIPTISASVTTEAFPETEKDEEMDTKFVEEPVINETEDAPAPSENEEFIMKTDSRLARFLYLLYAYFLLPVLAIEAISLLVASVGTSVAASDTPFIIVNVVCAAVYAMVISLSWQQFLSGTNLGLLLNRTLICVCAIRGFLMLLSGTGTLSGIIFIALSVLFLIYFIGYDTMFTVKPQKKQRVRH